MLKIEPHGQTDCVAINALALVVRWGKGERAMILYHFTSANLGTIEAEGLRPGDHSWSDWLGFDVIKENVVWLTASKGLVFRLEPLPARRFTVVIPQSDRRLVPFGKMLRRHKDQLGAWGRRALAFWVYCGSIPPCRITEAAELTYSFEGAPEAKTLEQARKALGIDQG